MGLTVAYLTFPMSRICNFLFCKQISGVEISPSHQKAEPPRSRATKKPEGTSQFKLVLAGHINAAVVAGGIDDSGYTNDMSVGLGIRVSVYIIGYTW